MVQVQGLESLGLSSLGCVSLSRCPWAQEMGPGCCGWVSTGQPCGGEPWRVSLCSWSGVPSASKVPLFSLLLLVSHLLCLPSSQPMFPGLRLWVWGPGKEASHPQGPKCLVGPNFIPTPYSFSSTLFSRRLGQTLFLMVFVRVERMRLLGFCFCSLRSDSWATQQITRVLQSWYK